MRVACLLLGLPAVLVAWAIATILAVQPLERHLRGALEEQSVVAALRREGARIVVAGRDGTLVSDFEPSAEARATVGEVPARVAGLRRLDIGVEPATIMTPFAFGIRRDADGIVLSGGVPGGALHARLAEAAESIAGASRVRDELRPALGESAGFPDVASRMLAIAGALSTGEATLTDTLIAVHGVAPDFPRYNAIVAGLASLPAPYTLGPFDVTPPEARPFGWSASRSGESVRLAGFVPSESARRALLAAAASDLSGVQIADAMQTARGLEPGIDYTAVTRLALRALGELETGTITLDGRRLAVSGEAPARDLLDALRAELDRNRPAGTELGGIDLRAVRLDPYRFAARRDASALTLTGYVPDAAQRDDLLALARRETPDQPVADRLHLADGAPDGFSAASRAAVEMVGDLASGRATLTGRDFALAGHALYPGVAARLRERAASGLPPGWSGSAEVTAQPYGRPLDSLQCGDLLAEAGARTPVRFEPGAAAPDAKSIAALADILRRCGPVRVKVTAVTAPRRDRSAAESLARARAEGTAARLVMLAPEIRVASSGEVAAGEPPAAAPAATSTGDRLVVELER